MAPGRDLEAQASPDVDRTASLLVPLGSTEQHGPHLPLGTDTLIAMHIARVAADRLGPAAAVVAPALPYGSSGEHAGFAGTLSIGQEALQVVLVELVRSASQTFRRTVFVNGHGGNAEPVRLAVAHMTAEGHDVVAWWPRFDAEGTPTDAHAGRTETSLLLAIAPELTGIERAVAGVTAPIASILAQLRRGGVVSVAPNGVLGDPAGASAEEGTRLFAAVIDDLVSVVRLASAGAGH